MKTYGDTYLFNQYDEYNKKILSFILNNNEIDTKSDAFADILFDLKRQNIGISIINVATSKNIKLMYGSQTLPTQFKVFAAKDLKGKDKKAIKVYIDCTSVLKFENGKYICRNIDTLLSYLISAMATLIYTADPNRIVANTDLTSDGASAYSAMFTHVLDYLFKISINPEIKAKAKYMTAMFYCLYVLQKDNTDSCGAIARRIAGISEREERVIEIGCDANTYTSLEHFIFSLNKVLNINLTLNAFVDKWMFIFGPSTVFGIEYFPAFSSALTDAYVGSYINNQKTIEKVVNTMIPYSKELFRIGANALNEK